jgi:triosephosphate isomerase (TIM)
MARPRPLIAGNWKMHGSAASAKSLVQDLIAETAQLAPVDILLLPPFPYLALVNDLITGTSLHLGAQDLASQSSGAYTGEVAGEMLRDCGATHVLVGHSERRALFAESNELVAEKFIRAQACGLIPILCVGESLAQRDAGATQTVVAEQLAAVMRLAGVGAMASSVVAYEPVWAIGTGRTATPAQAQEVHAALRSQIALADAKIAGSFRLLYGGSVKAANAADLLAEPDIDGALVGGASLDAKEFAQIARAAAMIADKRSR